MTGLKVAEVNVHVQGVSLEADKKVAENATAEGAEESNNKTEETTQE